MNIIEKSAHLSSVSILDALDGISFNAMDDLSELIENDECLKWFDSIKSCETNEEDLLTRAIPIQSDDYFVS